MKKKMLVFMFGFLLLGVNVFASGNLIVDGQIEVGLNSTATSGYDNSLTVSLNYTGGGSSPIDPGLQGGEYNINVLGSDDGVDVSWTGGTPIIAQSNVLQVGNSNAGVSGTYSLSRIRGAYYGIDRKQDNKRDWTLQDLIGVDIKFNDQGGGIGKLTTDELYGARFQAFATGAQFIATTAMGIYVGKHTGATNSYGIVLDGDGDGSDIVFGSASGTNRVRVSGNSTSGELTVTGDLNATGEVKSNGTVLTSDIRFKENVAQIKNSIDKLMKINGVSFDWKQEEYKEKNFDNRKHFGVIAQDIEKVLPEVVSESSNGDKRVAYNELIPLLIEALKEQQRSISDLTQEIADLKAEVKMKGSLAMNREGL
jgi:hypothetical protein